MTETYPYRRALVTGASSGIGDALARGLAARGVALVLVARRADRLEKLAAELRAAHGVEVEVLVADLTDAEQIQTVEKRLAVHEDPIDLLVNNAGSGTTGALATLPPSGEVSKVALNVMAVLRLSRAVLPRLIEAGHGGILNMSSLAAVTPSPLNVTYSASKAFVTSMSESLSRETRGTGVHVTAVLPGPAVTELTDEERFVITLPKFLWMTPEQIAERGLKAVAAGKTICMPSRVLGVATVLGQRMPRRLGYLIGDRVWRAPGS